MVSKAVAPGGEESLAPFGTYGESGAEGVTLEGTDRADHLVGAAGDDTILGLGGNDYLDGGAGDDAVFGGDGATSCSAARAPTNSDGGAADDILRGGGGCRHPRRWRRVRICWMAVPVTTGWDGGGGADRMSGGAGDDLLIVNSAGDLALEDGYGADGGAGIFSRWREVLPAMPHLRLG